MSRTAVPLRGWAPKSGRSREARVAAEQRGHCSTGRADTGGEGEWHHTHEVWTSTSTTLRVAAAWGLLPEDDPRAWDALRAAAAGPKRDVRTQAKRVLVVKRTLRMLSPEAMERVYR